MITREMLMEQIKQTAIDKAQFADALAAWQKAHGMEQYALFLLAKMDEAEAAKKFEDAKNMAAEIIAKRGGPFRPEDVEPSVNGDAAPATETN